MTQKEKTASCSERLFKKPGSYNVFRSDWKGFVRILNSVSFGPGRFFSDLDFGLDLWFLFGLDFGLDLWFLFGLDRLFCRIGCIKSIKTGLQVKAREHSILS
jgi:hypothetical protein